LTQIPERLQCTPHLNSHKLFLEVDYDRPRLGTYRGFVLRGKPDGRGEWREDRRIAASRYVGDWERGLPHGEGIQIVFYGQESRAYNGRDRERLWGEFCNGEYNGVLMSMLPEWGSV
jgi:hypothetical protein